MGSRRECKEPWMERELAMVPARLASPYPSSQIFQEGTNTATLREIKKSISH